MTYEELNILSNLGVTATKVDTDPYIDPRGKDRREHWRVTWKGGEGYVMCCRDSNSQPIADILPDRLGALFLAKATGMG